MVFQVPPCRRRRNPPLRASHKSSDDVPANRHFSNWLSESGSMGSSSLLQAEPSKCSTRARWLTTHASPGPKARTATSSTPSSSPIQPPPVLPVVVPHAAAGTHGPDVGGFGGIHGDQPDQPGQESAACAPAVDGADVLGALVPQFDGGRRALRPLALRSGFFDTSHCPHCAAQNDGPENDAPENDSHQEEEPRPTAAWSDKSSVLARGISTGRHRRSHALITLLGQGHSVGLVASKPIGARAGAVWPAAFRRFAPGREGPFPEQLERVQRMRPEHPWLHVRPLVCRPISDQTRRS